MLPEPFREHGSNGTADGLKIVFYEFVKQRERQHGPKFDCAELCGDALNSFLNKFLAEVLHCYEIFQMRPESFVYGRAASKEKVDIERVPSFHVSAFKKVSHF
jgi:hypothetical protein